jgi:nucleoid-associated protein YgaU
MGHRSTAVMALAAIPALGVLAPAGTGPTATLLDAVCVAAWSCTAWLLVVVLLESCADLPGIGLLAAHAVRRIAPASVRSLVRVALGTGLAASVLTAPAALAVERPPTVAGSPADALDWPGLAPVTAPPVAVSTPATSPALPSPHAPAAADPRPTAVSAHPRPPAVSAPRVVEVQPGDSLWSITRRALGPGATEERIAQTWPAWWSANRSVVGDDPGLIHPGDRLTAP